MFNSIHYVRDICQQRKIPISQLEKDCGFSNGYLNPKKVRKIPYDRAKVIAEYLGISVDSILNGPDAKTASTETDGRRIKKEDIMFALSRGREDVITDEMFEEIQNFADYVIQREENKKKEKTDPL